MKNQLMCLFITVFFSCSEHHTTPSEVAQVVVESFYKKNNDALKKHTTNESFESFLSIQGFITDSENKASDFAVIEEIAEGDIAWVKFTTSYEDKPETFKLVLVDGHWKVTEKGLREKPPFE
ncbi:hypothetical protein [Flagellimonas nanhaiensis]|uniref:DUF4878 domain-containing protein n=1 Tax=Flagellimonas nanhaiensis TaxID=2292706 RepID=A0A371JLG9_9FLAO|nr:hypothetical protein [Allomuricauda nanhaiensis]RDY57845.1 hypothetical protein DX873_16960 [Allomuricauda nanhaiensis]